MSAPEALIGAGGVSDSWLAQKSNVKNIFNDFRLAKPAYTALAPVPLVQLSEAQMCCAALWESAATFLVREYKIKSLVRRAQGCSAQVHQRAQLPAIGDAHLRGCLQTPNSAAPGRSSGAVWTAARCRRRRSGSRGYGDVAIPSEASCR